MPSFQIICSVYKYLLTFAGGRGQKGAAGWKIMMNVAQISNLLTKISLPPIAASPWFLDQNLSGFVRLRERKIGQT